jgi:hypothetical protein
MPHRKVTDTANRTWDVWEVIPSNVAEKVEERRRQLRISPPPQTPPIRVPQKLEQGWLAFQCEAERRRITPIPVSWSTMSDAELLGLLAQATRMNDART